MRTLIRFALASLVFLPFLARAQDGSVTGDAGFEKLVAGVFAFLVPTLLAVLGYFRKEKAATDQRTILRCVSIVYGLVNNVSKMTKTKVDDKAAFALGELEKLLTAHGIAMTEAVKLEAQAAWQAMHAAEGLTVPARP